jgi:hypothetical protein
MTEQEKPNQPITYEEDDGLSGYDEPDAIQDMMDKEDECYYGCDFCLDSFLRDNCGCIGCEVITPKNDEEAERIQGWTEKDSALEIKNTEGKEQP